MIVVKYTEGAEAISDFAIEAWLKNAIECAKLPGLYLFPVSNEPPILAVRVAVAKGQLSTDEVTLRFKGEDLPMNKDGRLDRWPEGFCDTSDKLLMELLNCRPKPGEEKTTS